MLEFLIAALCAVASLWYLFRRSTAVLRSDVNLPVPIAVAGREKKKNKHQNESVLRQEEARDPLVVYGTTTGNSWQFAEQLVREGQRRFGLTMRSQSLEDYDFEAELALESAVIVVVPTYDNGTPNATTKDFFNYLADAAEDFRVSKATLERVSFAVFGLGDTVYGDNFCAVARKIDECLKTLGGNRLLARGSGDAQYAAKQFETWMGRLWPSLLAALGMKDKLAELRKELKQRKAASSFKAAAEYVSDEEENEDKEPLADLEDLGAQAKGFDGRGQDNNNNDDEDDDDNGSSEAEEDDTPVDPNAEKKELLTPALTAALSKQGYQLIGTHSGVKLCRWTKAMLRGRGGCYKHTFYNITSYQCMEMTPSLACANKCVFCWRHGKNPVAKEWKWQMDQPEFLIEQSILKHQNMIRECKGVPGVVPERYNEAFTVRHCALSLVGEPIIYPQINRFVDLLHEKKISSFMVTNAQFPRELEQLKPVCQLYLSIDAATPETLKQIDRPVHKDYWERFLESIDILRKKQQRTVFRLTLVKEWNMQEMQDYAKLIERGMPEFIEVKGVTYCGNNKTSSLTIKNTPYHEEVCAFVQKLADAANAIVGAGTYTLCAAHEHSVCFLLAHKKFFIDNEWHTFIDYEKFLELAQSGKPFTSLDYVAKTPSWALFGSKEKGFDPEETRVFRKGKEGKRDQLYANQGC